jgi:hypothetical protein
VAGEARIGRGQGIDACLLCCVFVFFFCVCVCVCVSVFVCVCVCVCVCGCANDYISTKLAPSKIPIFFA